VSGEQTRHTNLLISLPLAGFISGVLSICVMSDQLPSPYVMGGIFGVVVGGFLVKAKALRNEGWAWLVIATTAAQFIALFSAYLFQLYFAVVPDEKRWNMGHGEVPVLSSLVFGGLVGGFVLIATVGTIFLIRKGIDLGTVIFTALLGAMCGGGLAAVGYALGPSFGSALWRILKTNHLTGRAYAPDTLMDFGQANVAYSLYLVWQTGMAFVIALMLRKRKPLREWDGSPR
jgi:hypothetical protein